MGQSLKRGSLSKQSSTTTAITSVTDVVSESQLFTSPSSIGSSRIAESSKNGITMIPICPWVLRIQKIKLPLMHYGSYATKCYQTVVCYLRNFVDILILITLNIRTKILVFSSVNAGHYGEKLKNWL
jgi:hypothetical protein